MTRYVVAAPYVTLKHRDRNGQPILSGFYAGAQVPADADEESVRRLLGKGMVIDADDPVAGIVAVPAGTPIPGEPPNVPVSEVPDTSLAARLDRARDAVKPSRARQDEPAAPAVEPSGGAPAPEPPAVNAPKADWVEHAVARGEDRGKAEGMSKEQLVGKFGKR